MSLLHYIAVVLMSGCVKMQRTLQENQGYQYKIKRKRPQNITILSMTQYPVNMVQTVVSYLYTGIMQKPRGTECELFEQLTAEYGLTPEYTVNANDLERIGKVQEAAEPQKVPNTPGQAANLGFPSGNKQEMTPEMEFENYLIHGENNCDHAHHHINDDAHDNSGDCEIKKEIENTVDDNTISDVDDLSGVGNDSNDVDDDNDLDDILDHNEPNNHTLDNTAVCQDHTDINMIDLDDIEDQNEADDINKDKDEEESTSEEISQEKEEWSMLCVPKMRPAVGPKLSFHGPRVINANKGKRFRTEPDSEIFTPKPDSKMDLILDCENEVETDLNLDMTNRTEDEVKVKIEDNSTGHIDNGDVVSKDLQDDITKANDNTHSQIGKDKDYTNSQLGGIFEQEVCPI